MEAPAVNRGGAVGHVSRYLDAPAAASGALATLPPPSGGPETNLLHCGPIELP